VLPRPHNILLHDLRSVREHLAFVMLADRDAVIARLVEPRELLRRIAAVAGVVKVHGAVGRDVGAKALALAAGHVVDRVHGLVPAAARGMQLLMIAAVEIDDELHAHREHLVGRRIRDPARVTERLAIRREVVVDPFGLGVLRGHRR